MLFFCYRRARIFDAPPPNGTEYDYIVVGSGTSGSVVAGRLAEAMGTRASTVEAPPCRMAGLMDRKPLVARSCLANHILIGYRYCVNGLG